jgi:hypothetical protein
MSKIIEFLGLIFVLFLLVAKPIDCFAGIEGSYNDDDYGFTVEGLGKYINCNRANDQALELVLDRDATCDQIKSASSPVRRITAYGEYNVPYEFHTAAEVARLYCHEKDIWAKWRHKYSLDGRKTIGCRVNEKNGVISVYAITLRKMDPDFAQAWIEIVIRLTTNKAWFDQDVKKFESLLTQVKIDPDGVDIRRGKDGPEHQ